MTIYTNAGLGIAMSSVIGTATAITGITKADPGVLTSAAHGLSDGEFVLLNILGMVELDERVFEVYAKDTNTFQLKDVDGASGVNTTDFSTFSSGTFSQVTFGTTVTGVQEFSPSGGDVKFLDTTTVHDLTDKQTVNGATAMSYTLTMQWDPEDAAQQAMKVAFQTAANSAIKITWPAGIYMMFYGTVGFSGAAGGTSQGVTTSPAAIAMNGIPTYSQ